MKVSGKMFAVAAALVMVLSASVILISDDSDASVQSVCTLEFRDGTASETFRIIKGNTVDLPTQLVNTYIKTVSGQKCYLSGWASGSSSYVPGESFTVSADRTFTAVWSPFTDGYVELEDGNASVDAGDSYEFIVLDGVKQGSASSERQILFTQMLNYNSSDYAAHGIDIPKWLIASTEIASGDLQTLRFNGTPTQPGNYFVHNGGGATNVSWIINVRSALDNSCTLSYSTGVDGQDIVSDTVQCGTAVKLPSGGSVSKTGYSLLGWKISDGKGATPTYGTNTWYTVTEDTVAMADWASDPVVVVYSSQGKVLGHDVVSLDEYHTIQHDVDAPSGYVFLGWRQQNDTQAAYADGMFRLVSGTLYLDAYLVSNSTSLLTVTYDANGGTSKITSQKVESGIYVYLPQNLVRENYTFMGWSTERDGTSMDSNEYQVTSSVTLYAVWEEKSTPVDPGTDPDPDEPIEPTTYKVYFDTNGGTGSYAMQKVYEGSALAQPSDPKREGYVFMGWTPQDSTTVWDFNVDTVDRDMILMATWEKHFNVVMDGLTATVTIGDAFASYTNTVNWGDYVYNSQAMSGKVIVYTYKGACSVNITVTSETGSGSGYRCYTSQEYVSATGPHVPDYPETPDDPDPDPSDEKIYPTASFVIKDKGDGYILDAASSKNAVKYVWKVDNTQVYSGSETSCTIEKLTDGTHTITLYVYSSTNTMASSTQTLTIGEQEEQKDNSIYLIVGLLAILGIAAVVVIR